MDRLTWGEEGKKVVFVGRAFDLRRGGEKVVVVSPLHSPLHFILDGERK